MWQIPLTDILPLLNRPFTLTGVKDLKFTATAKKLIIIPYKLPPSYGGIITMFKWGFLSGTINQTPGDTGAPNPVFDLRVGSASVMNSTTNDSSGYVLGRQSGGEKNQVIWIPPNSILEFSITDTGAPIDLSANQVFAEIEGYMFDRSQIDIINSILKNKTGGK